jgi:hypothetical protein
MPELPAIGKKKVEAWREKAGRRRSAIGDRDSRAEIRNPKQIQSSKAKGSKLRQRRRVWDLLLLPTFELVSGFGFRI